MRAPAYDTVLSKRPIQSIAVQSSTLTRAYLPTRWARTLMTAAILLVSAAAQAQVSVTVTANRTSPQQVGTATTWTATATGGDAPYYFYFYLSRDGSWIGGSSDLTTN